MSTDLEMLVLTAVLCVLPAFPYTLALIARAAERARPRARLCHPRLELDLAVPGRARPRAGRRALASLPGRSGTGSGITCRRAPGSARSR